MQFRSLHEEDVAARAFRDAAAPVEHERLGVTAAFGAMLLDRADHVEAGRLGPRRRRRRVRTTILGPREANAFQPLLDREIGSPIPRGDRQVDPGGLGRDAHHLAAAPRDRAHVAVHEIVGLDRLPARLVDLLDRVGDLEVERLGAVDEALRVLGQLEDFAIVGTFPLEHGAGIVQAVAEDMKACFPPGDQLAVEPDEAVAITIRHEVCHVRTLPRGPRLRPGLLDVIVPPRKRSRHVGGSGGRSNGTPAASAALIWLASGINRSLISQHG